MNKSQIRIIALVLVFFFSPHLFAEESGPDVERNWTIQVDPLTTFIGFAHLQIERKLTSDFSLYAGPHARLFSAPGGEKEDFLGFGLEMGLRWFPWGSSPAGAWALVRGVGAYVFSDSDEEWGGYISGLVGYTFILSDFFVLSGGAGIQYLHYRVGNLGPKGIFPALHTTFGFAF